MDLGYTPSMPRDSGMIEATVALLVALVLSFALFVAQEHEATKGARQLEQCEQDLRDARKEKGQ